MPRNADATPKAGEAGGTAGRYNPTPMVHRLHPTASVLSLMLCAAMAAVWPRTLRVGERLAYTAASDTSCSVETAPGRLSVRVTWNLPPVVAELQQAGFPQAKRGWSTSSIHWGTPAQIYTLRDPAPITPATPGEDDPIKIDAISVPQKWPPPAHGVLGIGWESRTYAVGPPIWTRSANVRSTRLVVPLWLVIAMTAMLPTVWLARRLHTHLRRRGGRCPACGYDLRASTERCPECGTPIPATS